MSHRWRRELARRLLAGALLLAIPGAGRAEPEALAEAPSGRRVVAVGDVHGADEALRAILRQAGVIDAEGRWSGGETVVVQTGDVIDRGAGSFDAVELLMRLGGEARAAGGEVVALLGNHEMLNLLGDLRDVTPEILARFVDERSDQRRIELLREHEQVLERRAALFGGRVERLDAEGRHAFFESNPPGLVEYHRAIGPEGRYGAWLRRRPVAVRLEGAVFVHGGLAPSMLGRDLAAINRAVGEEVATLDAARRWMVDQGLLLATAEAKEMVGLARKLDRMDAVTPPPEVERLLAIGDWLSVRSDGPLWFRGYASWSEAEGRVLLPMLLDAFEARRFVVGHTPQKSREIQRRFGGGVFLIDTGMLEEVYAGRAAALELLDGRATAIYAGGEEVLLEPIPAAPELRPVLP